MTAAPRTIQDAQKRANLEGRYGKIGISAVAAALPYKSDAKNPAYAPSATDPRDFAPEVEAA